MRCELLFLAGVLATVNLHAQWAFSGRDLHNTRSAGNEPLITAAAAANLNLRWSFIAGGDISATPAVSDNAVFVPDWKGNLYRLNATTGAVEWTKRIPDYTGVAAAVSRTTPAIDGDLLVIGTQTGGEILGIDTATGDLRWKVKPDFNEYALITQSPIIYNNRVYVGVSSGEEGAHSRLTGYVPHFRGSVIALDRDTGNILWRTYIVPNGYTGGAVWGSTVVVDEKRDSLYVTTGNNYTIPSEVQGCIDLARTRSYPNRVAKAAAEEFCLPPNDYIDAVVALNPDTGDVKWSRRFQGADTWTVACGPTGGKNACPDSGSPDYDFASGPNLFTVTRGSEKVDLLGAGQKSGVYWALNPDTGETVWSTQVGPGSSLGGIEWGSAADGTRVYVAIGNSTHQSYTLAGPNGGTHNAGSWAALDAGTGQVLWQVKVPGMDPVMPQFGAMALGAVTAANGLVFAGSTSGDMVVLDGATGATLKSFPTAGSVISGPAITGGKVYWGSGYGKIASAGRSNTVGPQLFAFEFQ